MDGGYRSWYNRRIPVNSPDLDDYGKPLPPPPSGFYWSRLEDGSWELLEYAKQPSSEDFITVQSSSVIEHVVLPSDTLQGLCLRYGVSAVSLRQLNNFSGSAFRSRKFLRVPLEAGARVRCQENTPEVKLQRFKNITAEETAEARFYLEGSGWDLDKALAEWSGDESWVRHEQSVASTAPVSASETHEEEEEEEEAPLIPKGVKVVRPLEVVYAESTAC